MEKTKYLSEEIDSTMIQSWENKNIFIESGTNSGKSYFITHAFSDYARKRNKRILLLLPRISIRKQFQQEIEKIGNDVVTIQSYQQIEKYCINFSERTADDELSKYDYLVLDECHYFEADSMINENTEQSLAAILRHKGTHIFMTATPERIKDYLLNIAKVKLEVHSFDYSDNRKISKIGFYKSSKELYSMIDLCVIQHKKCIVFANDIKIAVELYKKYENDSIFFCSRYKGQYKKYVNQDEIDAIVENNRFEKLMLITTTAIDAGFNIIDEELHNIFIHGISDINSIVQCIGRKRCDPKNPDDTIDVQLQDVKNSSINGRLSKLKTNITMADYLISHSSIEYLRHYTKRLRDGNNLIYDDICDDKDSYDKKVYQLRLYHCRCIANEYEAMTQIKDCGYQSVLLDRLQLYEGVCVQNKIDRVNELGMYLEHIVNAGKKGVMLTQKDRKPFLKFLNIKRNNRLIVKADALNAIFKSEYNLSYMIKEFKTSRILDDGKKKNYDHAWKIVRTG